MTDMTLMPRAVAMTQGWHWIAAGFRLFFNSPLIWVTFFLIYLALELALAVFVPVLGAIASALLDPILIAGFMAASRALELEEEMELSHLFAGFRTNTRQLVALGGYYFAGKVLIVTLAAAVSSAIHGPLPELDLAALEAADPARLAPFFSMGMLLMALLVPLLMAYWFAPALVLFDGLDARTAMKLSFGACLRNILPFTLYGVVGAVFFVLGSIPLGLGLLAVVPVLFATSIYAAYRDIFVAA